MSNIWHIFQLLCVHILDNYVRIYTSDEDIINNVTKNTGICDACDVYIHFTLLAYTPEQICLPYTQFTSCEFTGEVCQYTCHIGSCSINDVARITVHKRQQ